MAGHRMVRVNELIKREIGQSLFRVVGENQRAVSATTVTRVETTPNLREARVYVSILGDADVQQNVLHTLKRHRVDFQKAIADNMTLKYTPRLRFDLDESVRKGHKVLTLLAELEGEDTSPPSETGDKETEGAEAS